MWYNGGEGLSMNPLRWMRPAKTLSCTRPWKQRACKGEQGKGRRGEGGKGGREEKEGGSVEGKGRRGEGDLVDC